MPAASAQASSTSKEDALRQALLEFLEPNNILTCLNEAAVYWPIFVILVLALGVRLQAFGVRALFVWALANLGDFCVSVHWPILVILMRLCVLCVRARWCACEGDGS